LQNNFFGIGNDSKLDETLRDSESYFYESRSFAFLFKGRYPIHKVPGEINRFDELIIANTFYEYSLNNTGTAQISVENPQGFGKSYLRTLGTGFFKENRDHNFLPSRGNCTEFQIIGTIPGISKDLNAMMMFCTHHFLTFRFI